MKNKYIIGIDVGGTNIKLGLVLPNGQLDFCKSIPTKNFYRSKKFLIEALVKAGHEILSEKKISPQRILGVGIGMPGVINTKQGFVVSLTNIPGWRDVPLKSILEKELSLPVFLDNDVNVITLGEWKCGAGKGYQNLICITLGTGVGGGIILNNAIYRGEGFSAGEIGHIPINEKGPACNCGGRGCFEQYVGNKQLLRKAQKIFKQKDLRLEDVSAFALKGDKKAIRFWEETGAMIGLGLVGVINVLNPRLVIIGGGVSNSLRFMKKGMCQTILDRAMSSPAKMVKVVRSKLGNNAGIIGASVLVQTSLQKK